MERASLHVCIANRCTLYTLQLVIGALPYNAENVFKYTRPSKVERVTTTVSYLCKQLTLIFAHEIQPD